MIARIMLTSTEFTRSLLTPTWGQMDLVLVGVYLCVLVIHYHFLSGGGSALFIPVPFQAAHVPKPMPKARGQIGQQYDY